MNPEAFLAVLKLRGVAHVLVQPDMSVLIALQRFDDIHTVSPALDRLGVDHTQRMGRIIAVADRLAL